MKTTTTEIKEFMNSFHWEDIFEENWNYISEIIKDRYGISEARASSISYEMITERKIEA